LIEIFTEGFEAPIFLNSLEIDVHTADAGYDIARLIG